MSPEGDLKMGADLASAFPYSVVLADGGTGGQPRIGSRPKVSNDRRIAPMRRPTSTARTASWPRCESGASTGRFGWLRTPRVERARLAPQRHRRSPYLCALTFERVKHLDRRPHCCRLLKHRLPLRCRLREHLDRRPYCCHCLLKHRLPLRCRLPNNFKSSHDASNCRTGPAGPASAIYSPYWNRQKAWRHTRGRESPSWSGRLEWRSRRGRSQRRFWERQRQVNRVHPGVNQCVRSRHERTRRGMIRCVDHVVHRPRAPALPVNRERHGIRVAEFIAEPLAEDLSTFHGLQCTKLLVVAVTPPSRQPTRVRDTRPGAVDPSLREKVEHLDLVALPLASCNGFDGGPVALKGALVDQAEARRRRVDRRFPEHRVDMFVGVAGVDTE